MPTNSKGENTMKPIIATLALATLAACSTEQMVAQAQGECEQMGYAVGTTEHANCTERGFRQREAQAAAVTGTITAGAILSAFY
jgi:hypothetical protein